MDDKGPQVIAVVIIFFVLSWVAIGLRIYTRICVTRSFGSDDTTIMILQVFFTAYLIAQLQGWRHGLGKYDSEISPADRSEGLMWWWICFLLYIICVCLFKLSVGFFLLRIAVDTTQIWILRIFTGGTMVCGTVYIFLVVFQCQPPATYWQESPRTPGKCWGDTAVLGIDIWASLVNCIGDWTFGILPIFVVRGLNMRRRTKNLVMCLLSFAAIGSIATVVRMFYLPRLLMGDDYLYHSVEVAMLSTIESGVGITAVSLMTLQPLWDHWRGKIDSSISNSSWSGRSPGNRQRSVYIKADGSDLNTSLNLRPDNVMHISQASGPAISSPSRTSLFKSVPEHIPLADRTSVYGITRTMEVRQSRLDSTQINGLSESIPEIPPVESLSTGLAASGDIHRANRGSAATDQSDDASLRSGNSRLPFVSSLPSLYSIFNQGKRKSVASTQRPASAGPSSPRVPQPDFFDVSQTTGGQKEGNHSQVQLHQL